MQLNRSFNDTDGRAGAREHIRTLQSFTLSGAPNNKKDKYLHLIALYTYYTAPVCYVPFLFSNSKSRWEPLVPTLLQWVSSSSFQRNNTRNTWHTPSADPVWTVNNGSLFRVAKLHSKWPISTLEWDGVGQHLALRVWSWPKQLMAHRKYKGTLFNNLLVAITNITEIGLTMQ